MNMVCDMCIDATPFLTELQANFYRVYAHFSINNIYAVRQQIRQIFICDNCWGLVPKSIWTKPSLYFSFARDKLVANN